MDHRLGRVPSTFCYEAWFPARSQPFTASELHHIQTQLYRSFIFRGQHFYSLESNPDVLPWFEFSLPQA